VHVSPDILIVDEVLAVGDAAFKTKSKRKFAEFQKEGRTIILVSHSMPQVRALCDQVVWLDEGRMRSIGETDKVVDEYLEHVGELEARDDDS
jgi:ABC-2 type transport system ATP-binding protein